jgi:DNA-binding transcriptional ArsR family regulator
METQTSPTYQLGASICDDSKRATRSAEMIKALSHPIRLRIVAMLCPGAAHVSAMAERLGLKQSIVSQQLRILRMNGLVAGERQDRFTYYSLAEARLRDLIRCVEGCKHG